MSENLLADASVMATHGNTSSDEQPAPGSQKNDRDQLQQLMEIGLLPKVFPPERVILGMRVCRWMYYDLITHVDSVSLNGSHAEHFPAEMKTRTLMRLREQKLFLSFAQDASPCSVPSNAVQAMWGAAWGGFGSGLVLLNLTRNKLVPDCERLAQVLQQCSALTQLSLRETGIGGAGAGVAMQGLASCTSLTHLDLRGNEFAAQDLAGVVGKLHNLKELDIASNNIGWMGIGKLTPALAECSALQTLSIDHNKLSQLGGWYLLAGLQHLSSLSLLEINDNWIYSSGTRSLAPCLPDLLALAHLNLAGNDIREEGATSLAEVLPECAGLTHLDISRNHIRSAGAAMLAAALGRCQRLQELDLSINACEDEGACRIAAELPLCTALTRLDLSRNRVQASGARALALALGQCSALTALCLRGNQMAAKGVWELVEALGGCESMRELDVSSNGAAVSWSMWEGGGGQRCAMGRARVKVWMGGNELLGETVRRLEAEFGEVRWEFEEGADRADDAMQ